MNRRQFSAAAGAMLLVVALAASHARADCPTNQFYLPPAGFEIGQSPFHVVLADFNMDGILDVAATNNGASQIGVMLGIGNGTFHSSATYSVHSGNGHVIAVDFDRDGILDIATNSSGTDVVTVLRGRGDGTFDNEVTYAAGDAPYGIASADFNSDGIPDLASADFLANGISVLLGRATGGFAAPVSYSGGIHPYDLQVGDFNEDGIADLVVTNQDGENISVFLGHGSEGSGDGTFSSPVNYSVQLYPYSVAIADLNHDGIADLAVANAGVGTVSILTGHGSGGVGDGTFESATNLPAAAQPRQVTTGDFNGDRITDLAFADYYGSVSIMLGQGTGGAGNGTFSGPLNFSAGANPTGLAVGDLNADSLPDIVVANYQTNHVSVLIHGCGAPPPPPPSPAPTLTAVRDVPNDQGGRVFVTWLRSGLDGGSTPQVTGYRVWRRIAPAAVQAATIRRSGETPSSAVLVRRLPGPNGITVTYWEALITLPAERLEGYGYTAPTTQDSLASGNPYTAFFVTALTYDSGVFFQSNVDSGYSVDNIPPAQPGALSAAVQPSGVALKWASNHEADLDSYHVYRGLFASFQPGPANLVTANPDTSFVDSQGGAANYYKVTAVDRHGNEGPAARAAPASSTGVIDNGGLTFALRGATPNPSRDGVFTLSFTLPSSEAARLIVVDLAGRRVSDQVISGRGAGTHTIELGRTRPLPVGVYLVRLAQAGRSVGTKVVVTR